MPDVEIKLGGRMLNLRPTFGAMREIEAETKSACATLLRLLARHEMHAEEMATIIYHGLVGSGEQATDTEAIGKKIFDIGIGSRELREPVAAYLAELLYAPDSARKKDVGEWFSANEEITSRMFSLPPTPSDGGRETSGDPLPENSGQSSKPSVKNPSK